jgi:hypothetical protein
MAALHTKLLAQAEEREAGARAEIERLRGELLSIREKAVEGPPSTSTGAAAAASPPSTQDSTELEQQVG